MASHHLAVEAVSPSYEHLLKAYKDLQASHTGLQATNKALQKEKDHIEAMLSKRTKAYEGLQESKAAVVQEAKELKKANKELTNANAKLSTSYLGVLSKHEKLKTSNTALGLKCKELAKEKQELKRSGKYFKEHVEILTKLKAKGEQRCDELLQCQAKESQLREEVIAQKINKARGGFLQKLEELVDWQAIEKLLSKHYTKGDSGVGRKAYGPLLLFKMCLLETIYNLSDYGVESTVNDSLSFMKFCGLELCDNVPDHSVVSRFRTSLSQAGIWDELLALLTKQMESLGLLLKQGAIIDASITPTPRKPRKKRKIPTNTSQEATADSLSCSESACDHPSNESSCATEPSSISEDEYKPGYDKEASWTVKSGKPQYGYKRHYVADSKHGLVSVVHTSPANDHDNKHFPTCINELDLHPRSRVYADKGYVDSDNEVLLKSKRLRSGIQKKAARGRKLTEREKLFNTIVSRTRYKIERVFGSIKRWFGDLRARYMGLAKTHGQHVLEAIAYNLYRLPKLLEDASTG